MSRTVLYEVPDISNYQGIVNFKKVRDAGFPACILRAGWGQNNRDSRYADNAQACVNLNIPFAIYWFSYALSEQAVLREAEYAIKAADEYGKNIPIAFDLEYDSRKYAAKNGIDMNRKMITNHAILFLRAVRDAGHQPIIYSNRDYIKNYFDMPAIHTAVPETVLWFAYYSAGEPSEVIGSAMWQYTSKGRIDGIAGNVDVNKVYEDVFGLADGSYKSDHNIPATNLYIKEFQKACNIDLYLDAKGNMLQEDGIDGKCTQAARKKIALKASRILMVYRVGSTGAVVKWLQGRCNDILGCNLEVDGKYGSATRNAVIALQKKLNLTVDGIAGYNTLQACFYN